MTTQFNAPNITIEPPTPWVSKGELGKSSSTRFAKPTEKFINNYSESQINTMEKLGMGFDTASSFIPEHYNMSKYGKGNVAKSIDTVFNAGSDIAMAFPGVGTMIGGIMKGVGMLNKGMNALGLGTDQMTTTDAILNSSLLGLTPIGLINGLGGKKSDTYTRDAEIDSESGGSYQGFLSAEDEAEAKSGKKYGLFSSGARKKANQLIDDVSVQQLQLGVIEDNNKLNKNIAQNNSPFISMRQQMANSGGLQYAAVGKEGMEIKKQDVAFAKKVLQKKPIRKLENGTKKSKVKKKIAYELPSDTGPSLLKQGGTFNVIPEGALHKNKHHLDEIDEKFEDVTTKGIPVITEKDGEIIQHAEVEKEEIIFRLEVTKQIEKLMKEGTDEAAIEAGKLLVKEILHNTKDNANII